MTSWLDGKHVRSQIMLVRTGLLKVPLRSFSERSLMVWTLSLRSVSLVSACLSIYDCHSTIYAEDSEKGPGDRPKVDIIIADSGELEIEFEVDADGKQVPIHAEL